MNATGNWQQEVLHNLESAGGNGAQAAGYLRSRGTALVVVDNGATNLWWKARPGRQGISMENCIYISRHLADMPPDSAWLLASLVHEVKHLQHGFWTAFSVYGEMEAWQAGFNFYLTLPGQRTLSQPVQALLQLPLSHERGILKQARALINQDQNGGSSLGQQVRMLLRREKPFNRIYWILALPLNPLLSLGAAE